MTIGAEQWVTVATNLTEARANELGLVLTARNLPFNRQSGPQGWELWVPLADAPAAAHELTLYRHENLKPVGGTRPNCSKLLLSQLIMLASLQLREQKTRRRLLLGKPC